MKRLSFLMSDGLSTFWIKILINIVRVIRNLPDCVDRLVHSSIEIVLIDQAMQVVLEFVDHFRQHLINLEWKKKKELDH